MVIMMPELLLAPFMDKGNFLVSSGVLSGIDTRTENRTGRENQNQQGPGLRLVLVASGLLPLATCLRVSVKRAAINAWLKKSSVLLMGSGCRNRSSGSTQKDCGLGKRARYKWKSQMGSLTGVGWVE